MSAYIESPAHLRVLTQAVVASVRRDGPIWYGDKRIEDGDYKNVFDLLYAQNVRSVSFRYEGEPRESLPGYCGNEPYEWRALPFTPDALKVLKALAGYEYQSCETPDWEQTDAYRLCQALRARLVSMLPGYDEAETWSIKDVKEAMSE